jgi:branched-chain amino acid transport system ATP-binding protein
VNLIELHDVYAGYGGAPILNGIDIAVAQSDIAVVVGANGAGKSTVLKAIFGLVAVSQGEIEFDGQNITNSEPDRLVPKGLSFVPQEFNVFTSLTVEENLEMGAYIRRDDYSGTMNSIFDMFPDLGDKRGQKAGELSGGQRQMVALGRALMSQPKMLLLDEPSAGLSPLYVQQIFELVQKINQSGVGILMVEQNARHALEMATNGIVVANGKVLFADTSQALLADPEVAKSFLGG